MANYPQLRARARGVLQSDICNRIRFKLDNIRIQSFMYGYIGNAIGIGQIQIQIGGGSEYTPPPANTFKFLSEDVPDYTIVHEATHAVINATNRGRVVTKGTHETSAYLAETVYSIQKRGEAEYLDVPGLTPVVARLARELIEFNKNPSATFVCPDYKIAEIKAILQSSRNAGYMYRPDRQLGIGD